ncbi:hypothetical protein ACFLRB_04805 [Acidobacteriota bacterium]
MTRPGREAEAVVEQLEKLLAGESAVIRSPDRIYDQVAGIYREVDISVRSEIGSHEILIIIECRDRPSAPKEDVTWIEQLITKTKDLKANKVVAVSTTDFTSAARKKANFNDVELRILREFDPDEVNAWVNNITIEYIELKYDLINIYVGLVSANISEQIDPMKIKPASRFCHYTGKTTDEIFIIGKTGVRTSLDTLIMSNASVLYKNIKPNTSPVKKTFHLLFFDPLHMLSFESDGEYHRVFKIEISANFWIESMEIPVKKAIRYMWEKEEYAERLDYNWTIESGEELTFSIQRDLKKRMQNVIFFVKNGDNQKK